MSISSNETISANAEPSRVQCPECGTEVPSFEEYRPWCECGWNLQDENRETPVNNLLGKLYQRFGDRRAKALLETIKSDMNAQAPNSTILRSALFIIGVFVLLSPIVVLALTAALIASFGINLITIWFAIALIYVAWTVRPRITPIPRDLNTKRDLPETWKLVETVCSDLGCSPPDAIVLTPDYGAYAARCGFTQKRILGLGLPLFYSLSTPERVALIAHEMNHFMSGDCTGSGFIGMAIESLNQWCSVLNTDTQHPVVTQTSAYHSLGSLVNRAASLLALVIPYATLWIAVRMHCSLAQIAEYKADLGAAKITGVRPLISCLVKAHLDSHLWIVVQRSVTRNESSSILDNLRNRLASIPERELARLRRLIAMDASRLHHSHPPTSWRIDVLDHHGAAIAPLVSPNIEVDLDEELREHAPAIEDVLRTRFQEGLCVPW